MGRGNQPLRGVVSLGDGRTLRIHASTAMVEPQLQANVGLRRTLENGDATPFLLAVGEVEPSMGLAILRSRRSREGRAACFPMLHKLRAAHCSRGCWGTRSDVAG